LAPLEKREPTMVVCLYRYPHPFIQDKWLYVGQGIDRDKRHRSGKSSFGRRFQTLFPNATLPQPVRWEETANNCLDANCAEILAMFKYHTWRGYPGGMNLTFPGSHDYKNISRLGGIMQPREAKIKGGKSQSREARIKNWKKYADSTPLSLQKRVSHIIAVKNGTETARENVKSGQASNLGKSGLGGRTVAKIPGHMAVLNRIAMCLRWNVHRGKPCTCGKHQLSNKF